MKKFFNELLRQLQIFCGWFIRVIFPEVAAFANQLFVKCDEEMPTEAVPDRSVEFLDTKNNAVWCFLIIIIAIFGLMNILKNHLLCQILAAVFVLKAIIKVIIYLASKLTKTKDAK